jgi:hypothetical protein
MASESRYSVSSIIYSGKVIKRIILLIVICFALLLFPSLKVIVFSLISIVIGVLSLQYQRYIRFFGFELCTFSTILCSLAYGPLAGALVGISAYVIGQAIVGQLSPYSVITIAGFGLAAILASMLGSMSLPIIMISLIVNIVVFGLMGIGWISMGFPAFETIYVSVIAIVINQIVFSVLGSLMFGVMVV